MIRVADYIIERLAEQNIKEMFLITGRGILYLSDALAKNQDITPISVHHEQAAAFAAVAYAQYNDTLGACLISTGCASTNTITGVLNAWQDGVPCVFVSGQNKLHETVGYTGKSIRTFGSQEANILPIVQPITKYCTMVTDAKTIGEDMDKAIYYATTGVKGPVWIDVPVDVQNMRVEPTELSRWEPPQSEIVSISDDVNSIVAELNDAQRPVVLIGNGIRSANAISELKLFVENNNIPVVFSHSAVDVYGCRNSLSIGTVGTIGGTRAGNFTIQNSDYILSIGCRLSSMLTGSEYTKFARNAKLVVVDIDSNEHSKETVSIDKLVTADAKQFLEAILTQEIKRPDEKWVEKCLHWKSIFPKCEAKYKESDEVDIYNLADTLSRTISQDAIITCDAGLEEIITPSVISYGENQRCIHPASQGCMGVALAAAIGAYYASKRPVTVVVGDGSIMMNLQELQTIAFYKLPIRIIVVNNNVYSVIRKRQIELFRTRTVGTDPENGVGVPEFNKVADCFGLRYMKINNSSELEDKLYELEQIKKPIICEVMAVSEQDYIRSGAAFNSQRKFVNRPLEDQYPWMDRELFISEMIVEPIDI